MFFIRNNQLGHPPWTARGNIIVDSIGRLIAVVPQGAPRLTVDTTHGIGVPVYEVNMDSTMTEEEHRANLELLACAPELLEALKEAAFHLDAAGIPLNQQFYDLINRASPNVAPLLPFSKTVDKEKI